MTRVALPPVVYADDSRDVEELEMRSPWKTIDTLDPDTEYLALASAIPTRSLGSTWRMFRGASAVRSQLASTPGVVGFSLLARPLRKYYATLSVWTDEGALDAFVAERPHTDLMGSLADEMTGTRFERWTITGAQGRPSWAEALRRLS